MKRRAQIAELVMPPEEAISFESKEFDFALSALSNLYAERESPVDYWKANGWLNPHVLAVVHLPRRGVCVPRIAQASGDLKVQSRIRADGGVILDQQVFPNRFAAQVAKGQVLMDLREWRVLLPTGYVSRGRTEAWLAEAPRKQLSWYYQHAPVKPPRKRARQRS